VLRIVVMNAKGGSGKTTVATNLASYCAAQARGTQLFDYDAQASSSHWLKVRPDTVHVIHGVEAFKAPEPGITRSWQLRVLPGTEYVIKDTPAGTSGIGVVEHVQRADIILIPVLPSAIDIHSTANFIRDLLLRGKARTLNKHIGIIANRTRVGTRSLRALERFLRNLDIPVIAHLRDTQNYLRAAERGLGVCDLPDAAARQDQPSWQAILEWVQQFEAPSAPSPSAEPALSAAPRSGWVF
jgi:chromosome partitioning protein